MTPLKLFWMFLFLLHASLFSQVVISEIMFDVPGADYHDEFVELFNCSDSAVDLTGWQISDSSGTDDLLPTGQGLLLQPRQFAVILDGSYFQNSTTYDSLIPPEALVLKIGDGAFGSNGWSNSIAEPVLLFDDQGRLVDRYRYSLDNQAGYSDEKINLCEPGTVDNWANSRVLWGTPGFKNSVAPFDFDLGFSGDGLTIQPQSAIQKGQAVLVKVKFYNAGLQRFEGQVKFLCFLDLNGNRKFEVLEPELFEQMLNVNLLQQQKDSLQFTVNLPISGRVLLAVQMLSKQDQNSDNNFVCQELTVLENQASLVLNEIKFLTQKGEPEWIELFNKSNEAVSLYNWAVSDLKDTMVVRSNIVLPAQSYFVLTADSAFFDFYDLADSLVYVDGRFPTLNNDGDVLFLLAPWGGWVEQVPYTIDWLTGQDFRQPSLERINPDLDARQERNWAPCVKQGTPGERNSVYSELQYSRLKMQITPNPFSPDGDGHEDFALISLQVPAQTARLRVLIFDMLGRAVRTLTENQFVGQEAQIVWDGRDNHKKKVRMGIYIVFVQMIDDANGVLKEVKNTVVVAY